jgi:ElaB/YqjD/DUF883 family membrane-anchored ribosome-binding protein
MNPSLNRLRNAGMYENSGSGAGNGNGAAAGAAAGAGAEQVKEHLRAAKDAAGDAIRGATRDAQTWGRTQFADLQDRIEAEPYRAAAWALGIGFVAGVLITALARRR